MATFPSRPTRRTIGLAMPLPPTTSSKYLPEFTVGDNWGTGFVGGSTVFGNESNLDVTNNFTFDADLTKTWGAHTLEFGGEVDEFQYGNPGNIGHANGDFGFGAGFTQYNPHNQNCYPAVAATGNTNTCASNAPNGSALASLYLGVPSQPSNTNVGPGGIDWNRTVMEGQPVFAVYFQDNWRVSPRLTLNMGIRYDVQRGLRDRFNGLNRGLCLTCVNPITNNATYQANVANASNAAAWTLAGINPASLDQVLGGVLFTGTDGQSRNAYNTDWSNVGPRLGFAFVVDPKTVIRGGWGLMYSYGLEGGSNVGSYQTTNYTTSIDGGNTPTNNFQSGSPFSSGLLAPTGNTLGLETDLGNGGIQVDFPDRKIPMEQILSLGFQRELPGGIVLDARLRRQFHKPVAHLPVDQWNGHAPPDPGGHRQSTNLQPAGAESLLRRCRHVRSGAVRHFDNRPGGRPAPAAFPILLAGQQGPGRAIQRPAGAQLV